MTAYAIDFRADRLVVASDTRCYSHNYTLGHMSKIHVLPHLRSVALFRGACDVQLGAVARLFLSPQILCIEDAAAKFPSILCELTESYYDIHADVLTDDMNDREVCHATLVGWSEAEQRMRAFQFFSPDEYQVHEVHDYGGVWAWPAIPRAYLPLDRTADPMDDKLIGVLEAIDRFCVENPEHVGGARLGGSVVKTVVTEKTIATTTIGAVGERMH